MEIAIQRTECFGSCPIYKATFDSEGMVHFDGQGCVSKLGSHTYYVPRFRFTRTLKKANEIQFKTFRNNYRIEDCITDPGDLPSTKITINDGVTEKSVHYYLGCMDPSFPELSNLEDLKRIIESETEIRQFVDVEHKELKNCES